MQHFAVVLVAAEGLEGKGVEIETQDECVVRDQCYRKVVEHDVDELLHGKSPRVGTGQQVADGLWTGPDDRAAGSRPKYRFLPEQRKHVTQPLLVAGWLLPDAHVEIDAVKFRVDGDQVLDAQARRRA